MVIKFRGKDVPGERQNTLTPLSIATLTNFGGEDSFIVQLVLDPCHKVVNVLGGRALDWLLHRCTISPMILIPGGRLCTQETERERETLLWSCTHDGTGLCGTVLCDGSIQHVYLIEEVNSWKRESSWLVLRRGEKYSLLTAIHSFRSSPSGSWTASFRFPLPRVAAACFIMSCW